MSVDAKYWTEAKATGGGRNGTSGLVNGQLTVTMASPKELGGSGLGHNPEELFATGYAACYLGEMRFAAQSEKLGTVPDTATVNAHVGIGPRSDGGFGLKVKLVVSLPGLNPRPMIFSRGQNLLNSELLVVDDRCLCIPTFDARSSADVVLFTTGYAKIVELNFCGYAFMQDDVECAPVQLKFDPAHHEEIERSYKAAVQSMARFDYQDSDWLQTDSELPDWKTYRRMVEVKLELSLLQKRRMNAIYSSRLPKEIQLPAKYQTWRFNIRVKNKKQVMDAVVATGLFASSHYASLAGVMSDGRAPVAESLAGEVSICSTTIILTMIGQRK